MSSGCLSVAGPPWKWWFLGSSGNFKQLLFSEFFFFFKIFFHPKFFWVKQGATQCYQAFLVWSSDFGQKGCALYLGDDGICGHAWFRVITVGTYESMRTSLSVLLTEMMSDAIRLNWLILNFSFISASCDLGITTALPISPGPSGVLLFRIPENTRTWFLHLDLGPGKIKPIPIFRIPANTRTQSLKMYVGIGCVVRGPFGVLVFL